MTKFIYFIFSGGGAVVFLLVTALWLRTHTKATAIARILFAIALGYAVASIYIVDYGIGRLLVARFHPFGVADAPSGPTAIVVLGSSSVTMEDWHGQKFSVVDSAGTARVLEAFRVFELVKPAWIISSGGQPDPDDPSEPSGTTMRDALIGLGVPAARILVEIESKDTHDEAVIVAPMLQHLHIDRVVLVTSDTHMRRSIGTFRAEGIDAVPAIARHAYLPRRWRDRYLPSERGLAEASVVAHEVLGIPYYALRGWYRF